MAQAGGGLEMKSIYKGGIILLLGFIFLKMGGVLFRIICMGVLPVEAYGEVALFLVIFNWLVLFGTLNVTIGLAKFVSQKGKDRDLYYKAALSGSVLLSLAVSAVLFVFSPFVASLLNMSITTIHWAALCIPFAAVYNTGIFYFRGLYKMGKSVTTDALMMAARICMLSVLLAAGLYYAPFVAFLASFVAVDAYLLLKNRIRANFDFRKTLSAYRMLLVYSLPIFAGEFLRAFSVGLDRVMIAGFYSTAEAGFYDVAVALCLGYVIIANSYSNALLPSASRNQADIKKRKHELRKAAKACTFLFAAYTALLLLAGAPVINMINPAYLGVFSFIIPLAGAYIIFGFLSLLCFYSSSIGQQKNSAYAMAVFAFLSLALNFYLIPQMLYGGAVTALAVSSSVSIMLLGALAWRSEGKESQD